ncbi:ricin-type beta-trefoil lectin domain protein [Streptacidiphilus sp. EB129]|uniref:ricin-type beta-trefoil lectin domain protein n=1 Tax=Streptacidiphilus sp. EB129 TaxID=3156262 RepID=UPI003518BB40
MVRALATACDSANRGVPATHAIVVGADTVWFHLRTPDEQPPAGWTSDDDGRTWHAQLRRLQSASVAESLEEPYPQLVSLGSTGRGFVLLNLRQAGGVIGLEGDARQARALAQDWTRELATNPWSRGVRVVRIGFKPGVGDPEAATGAKTLAEAEAALADEGGGVLLLAGAPGGRDRERVTRLADDPEGRWSVVVVGRVEDPRWRFTIDSAGVVDTGLLDEPVAHRLDPSADVPAPGDPDADPAGDPDGGSVPGSRRPGRLFTPGRLIVAVVAVACLAGAALFLVPGGISFSSTPAAKAAGTHGATPGASASPTTTPSTAGTAASNGPNPLGVHLVNHLTGKCLSGSAGSDGTPLILYGCDDNAQQRWNVVSDGTIQTNGLCMDAAGGGTTAGTIVQIARCSGNPAQQFSLRADTLYAAHANMCVDAPKGGTAIRLAPCNGSASEVFRQG